MVPLRNHVIHSQGTRRVKALQDGIDPRQHHAVHRHGQNPRQSALPSKHVLRKGCTMPWWLMTMLDDNGSSTIKHAIINPYKTL